jgi:hypothetical protein
MPLATASCEEPIEECIEALDELILSLERHPPGALAEAMGAHLEALLRAMLAAGECSACDIKDFLREIEHGALD